MDTNLFVKHFLLGNEDAQAFQDEGLYQLAEKRGFERDTFEFRAFVAGGVQFRFNGNTFEAMSADIEA